MNRYPINPDRLELLSIQERAERRLLPDELLLKDIGLLIYPDKPDRISFYHDVLKACHENRINYTGDIDNDNWKVDHALLDFTEKPDEHLDYFEKLKRTEDKRNLFIKQAEIDIYSVLLPPSCYLHRDEIKDYFKSIKLWPITDCLLANWFEGEQLPEAVKGVDTDKARKKRKPLLRQTTEGLLLIEEILEHYKIKYLDELSTHKAWVKIISGEFTSDYIKKIADTQKRIELIGGDKLDKQDFSDKYRRRFK